MFVIWLLFGVALADFDLLILHNNDMHSAWTGTDANSAVAQNYWQADYGGYLRLKTKKNEVEAKAKAANVLFLNAGDNFSGSPWFSCLSTPTDKVELTATFVKDLEFDALCPGNHEFDLKIPAFIEYLNIIGTIRSKTKRYLKYSADCYVNSAEFDADNENIAKIDFTNPANWFGEDAAVPIVVAANVVIDNTQPELRQRLRRSVVRLFETSNGKVPVGIIGYLTKETQKECKDTGITIANEVEYVEKEAKRLAAMGVEIIIALGHSGFEIDQKIAEIAGIDAVIGGHSNTFMYNSVGDDVDLLPEGKITADNPKLLPYPVLVKNVGSDGFTPVVQAFAFTKYLGKLALHFDGTGQVEMKSSTDINVAMETFTKCNPPQNPILLNDKLCTKTVTDAHLRAAVDYSFNKDWINNLKNAENKFKDTETMKKPSVAFQAQPPTLNKYLEGGDICRKRECIAANAIVDGYMDYFVKPGQPVAGFVRAQIAKTENGRNLFPDPIGITNGGGIRAPIGDIFTSSQKPKSVTMWDIMIVTAKIGDIGIVEISRDNLMKAFKHSISQWYEYDPTGRLLQVSSNVQVTYDFDQMIHHTVDNKNIQIPTPIVEIWSSSDNKYCNVSDPKYEGYFFKVVITPYLRGGCGGFDMLKSVIVGDKVSDWDSTINYLQNATKVEESRNSKPRIIFKGTIPKYS